MIIHEGMGGISSSERHIMTKAKGIPGRAGSRRTVAEKRLALRGGKRSQRDLLVSTGKLKVSQGNAQTNTYTHRSAV